MEKINFIYEWEEKYITGVLKNNKIHNKKFYYQNIENLNLDENIHLFLKDNKLTYFQKYIIKSTSKKISIKDIENEISEIDLERNVFLWYNISNIKVNWKKENFLLWQSGDIEYVLWIYTISRIEYDKIIWAFWKNTKLNIYPNSLFLIRKLEINNWNILYIWKNHTEIINVKNWFYFWVEKIELGTSFFENKIKEIFWKNIATTANLSSFHKKIYEKELNKFLVPINFFVKENLKWNIIYSIWDFSHFPNLIENISKETKSEVIPIRIDNKTFLHPEQANIYCIWKYFK